MRRKALKWLQWSAFFLMLNFLLVKPDEVQEAAAAKTAALANHAGIGLLLAIVIATWVTMYWRQGPVGRPGPKLSPIARRAYFWMHRMLYRSPPLMILAGALAGLAAPFPVLGFGVVPLWFGIGGAGLHDLVTEIHELGFDALLWLLAAHLVFHLWRHYLLQDNALRIVLPRPLHRWL